MSILHLLSADNFITVNRRIAEIVGLEAAVIFGELASESLYWQQNNPEGHGWFYSTVENLEKKTFLSAHSQRIALIKLQEQGWIEVEKRGMPAKRFIRLKEDEITKVVNNKSLKILTTSDEKNEQQVVQNLNGNNNIDNKNIEKRIEGDKEPAPTSNIKDHIFFDKLVNKEDIACLIDILMNAYPYSKKTVSREIAIDVWLASFKDNTASDLHKAVIQHINSSAFYPAITEIQEQLKRVIYLKVPEKKEDPDIEQPETEDDDKIDDILADLGD